MTLQQHSSTPCCAAAWFCPPAADSIISPVRIAGSTPAKHFSSTAAAHHVVQLHGSAPLLPTALSHPCGLPEAPLPSNSAAQQHTMLCSCMVLPHCYRQHYLTRADCRKHPCQAFLGQQRPQSEKCDEFFLDLAARHDECHAVKEPHQPQAQETANSFLSAYPSQDFLGVWGKREEWRALGLDWLVRLGSGWRVTRLLFCFGLEVFGSLKMLASS